MSRKPLCMQSADHSADRAATGKPTALSNELFSTQKAPTYLVGAFCV